MFLTLDKPKTQLLYLVSFSEKFPTKEKHDIKMQGNNVSIDVPCFLNDRERSLLEDKDHTIKIMIEA